MVLMASAFVGWSAFNDLVLDHPDALSVSASVVLRPDTAFSRTKCAGVDGVTAQRALGQLQVVLVD